MPLLWRVKRHALGKVLLVLCLVSSFRPSIAAEPVPTKAANAAPVAITDNEPLPIEAMRRFVDVYEKVRLNYVEPIKDDVLFDNALSGLLSKLDPYSDYLDAKSYDALVDFTDGEIGQTGMVVAPVVVASDTPVSGTAPEQPILPIMTSAPQWQITSVPKGSPAAKAGVLVGDILQRIDGKSVKAMSQGDIEQSLRGPRNSFVRLTVMQPAHHPRELRVLLAIPEDNAVKALTQADGIVVLQIRAFQTQTGEQITTALDPLYESGALKGIVLDLRDNPGGLLAASIEVANDFLGEGVIVSTQGRSEPAKYYRVVTPERYPRIPVSILINHYSASAAEVLTAALRDHHRAKVYGVTSYGKGSVQKILPIGQGRAIKMTVSRYYTPNGKMIEGTGIDPDVLISEADLKPIKSNEDSADPRDIALQKVISTLGASIRLTMPPATPALGAAPVAPKDNKENKDNKVKTGAVMVTATPVKAAKTRPVKAQNNSAVIENVD
jgi:carboxyl-terminal processing protease